MAERPAFFIRQGSVVTGSYTFEWFPGFAASQKQKSIDSLHKAVKEADAQANPLEISSKSANPLGVKLSAFNLCLNNHTLENIFQSAKLFENGGPYLDLLEVPPREAKRDERLHNSGQLKAFCYQGAVFPLTPQTVFYDYTRSGIARVAGRRLRSGRTNFRARYGRTGKDLRLSV